jgi:chemotaxis response regulator CheB
MGSDELSAMKRVLICGKSCLFFQGLVSLLHQDPELDIMAWDSEVGESLVTAQGVVPDVVIVSDIESLAYPALTAVRCLKEGRSIKIIEVNLRDNSIYICRGEGQTISTVEDLIDAIKSPPGA